MQTVLVVNGVPAAAPALGVALRGEGFEVVEAETATPELSVLPDVRVDVAVVDIGIPSDKGLEVCRDIWRRWQAPVVVVAAATDTDLVVAFLDAGVDDYLAWPVDARVVTARLRAILRREPLARQRLSPEDRH